VSPVLVVSEWIDQGRVDRRRVGGGDCEGGGWRDCRCWRGVYDTVGRWTAGDYDIAGEVMRRDCVPGLPTQKSMQGWAKT